MERQDDEYILLNKIGERLSKIDDKNLRLDICSYFITIYTMSLKVKNDDLLFTLLPSCYHDLTISDLISLSDEQLEQKIFMISDYDKAQRREVLNFIENADMGLQFGISESRRLCTKYESRDFIKNFVKLSKHSTIISKKRFSQVVLNCIMLNECLFNAGVALFYDDDEFQKVAKQYKI